MFFLRKSNLERLPIAMVGVRMGERVLQIGVDDPSLAGSIAAKVGLSGQAAIAVADEAAASKARSAAGKAGVLVDVQITSVQTLPFADADFDVVVINGMGGLLSKADESARGSVLRETARVLRSGGRVVVIEAGPRQGLSALLRPARSNPAYDAKGGAAGALALAGFRSRVLAQREGYRFTEGLKL